MIILGIETSCDETAIALYQGDMTSGQGSILAERVASQIRLHAKFGGVVPEVASREHMKLLPPMVDEAMATSGILWRNIDRIAVTAGPGLMGALLVGVCFARGAGAANGIPVVPVHHMEGHLLAPGLSNELPQFPFITLLVSGGHTMLVRVDGIDRYAIIGQTLDDAAGECFDKCARLLHLPYPGGPEIARLALTGHASRFPLPRPMLNRGNLDFSFSGLKTAVLYSVRDAADMDGQALADMAAAVEKAICEVLVKKSVRACRESGITRLVIAGGVAANRTLRSLLFSHAEHERISVHMPDPAHCTDNAAMIAYAAFQRLINDAPLPDHWDVNPRWSIMTARKV